MKHLQKITMVEFPREAFELLGLPARLLEYRWWPPMAKVGKKIMMPESEAEGVEIILKTHNSQGAHQSFGSEGLKAMNGRHGIGGGSQSDIPNNQRLIALLQTPAQIRLLDV